MRFKFTVEVELERSEGKFASRDEMEEQLIAELEAADPGELTGENEGQYSVIEWEVSA